MQPCHIYVVLQAKIKMLAEYHLFFCTASMHQLPLDNPLGACT